MHFPSTALRCLISCQTAALTKPRNCFLCQSVSLITVHLSDLCPQVGGSSQGTGALLFPLPKPALPFFTQRMGREGQGDCAELCAPPLQSLPGSCWKTLRKGRLKATPAPSWEGFVGILSLQEPVLNPHFPFNVPPEGSKTMTNSTTIILQKTYRRLFSSLLLERFLTSISVFSNTMPVIK